MLIIITTFIVTQDPALRPSAQELLDDPFVREAQLPEDLKHRISEHLAHQKPVRCGCMLVCMLASKHAS